MTAGPGNPDAPMLAPRKNVPKVMLGIGLMALLAMLVVFHAFDPAQSRLFPRCAFHALTGLDCPGCGGQRAVHHLLHGDIRLAFRANALLLLLAPVGCWLALRWLLGRFGHQRVPAIFLNQTSLWLLVVVLLLFGLVRNLPGFDWLRP